MKNCPCRKVWLSSAPSLRPNAIAASRRRPIWRRRAQPVAFLSYPNGELLFANPAAARLADELLATGPSRVRPQPVPYTHLTLPTS